MKRKLLLILLALCVASTGVMSLVSCNDDDEESKQPQKLATPTVTLTDGVATWAADANAEKFEISLDGALSYMENTVTSKKLEDGQTLKVRAVGDGSSYATSDWSHSVTYVAQGTNAPETNTPETNEPETNAPETNAPETNAPETSAPETNEPETNEPGTGEPAEDEPAYLGILVSGSAPTAQSGVPEQLVTMPRYASQTGNQYRSLEDALAAYFADEENHLGSAVPSASSYDLYSRSGETVYIQIWLDNPSQYTILSLLLNGTKYQVSGGLSSFFIEEGGVHYNCVYVAVTLPSDAHTEKSYTVSSIEYISDTYINADGTDEFMNENDTVTVGLPYPANAPHVSNFTEDVRTYKDFAASFKVSDRELADLCGGWLGVAIYDGYDVILNQAVAVGDHEISTDALIENKDYSLTVYLYGDLHDGRGVRMHALYSYDFRTNAVIPEFTAEAEYYANWGLEGLEEADSGLAIRVEGYLDSQTARHLRLELYKGDTLVRTVTEFYGHIVLEDLLANTEYLVKLYYTDTGYEEHVVETSVTTGELKAPEMALEGKYSFLSALTLRFADFENGWQGVALGKDVQVRLYANYEELRYADLILALCDDPSLLTDARDRYEAAMAAGQYGLASKIYHEEYYFLEYADRLMREGDYCSFGDDKAAWQAFFDERSRTYTCDEEDFFRYNGVAHLIVRDCFEELAEDWSYEVSALVDYKDGRGYVRTVLTDGSIGSIAPINGEGNYLTFNVTVDGYTATVTPKFRMNGEETNLAMVAYEIGLYLDGELVKTIYNSSAVDFSTLDEESWINTYVAAMKGEAILPETEAEIIEQLGYRAIFELLNGIHIDAEEDFTGGGNGETSEGTVAGGDVVFDENTGDVVVGGGGGRGEKHIANLAERELLRALLAYDYPANYEYRIKTQMLEDFMRDEFYDDLIAGCEGDDEKLEALIAGACNSTVVSVLNKYVSGVYHYMYWYGKASDDIFVGFKAEMESYIEENGIVSDVNWAESYRRIMLYSDFDRFYPFGTVEKTVLTVDTTGLDAGEYKVGVSFRRDYYEEGHYDKISSWSSIRVAGKLPVPSFTVLEGGYLEVKDIQVQNFYGYTYELVLENALGEVLYSGRRDNFDASAYPLRIGYKARVRAVLTVSEDDTYYRTSDWSSDFVYEGIKLAAPTFGEYSLEYCTVTWWQNQEGVDYFVYTLNGGAEYTVAKDGDLTVALSDSDVLRVRAIAALGGEYVSSDWAEFVCSDKRVMLGTPNATLSESGMLTWDEVEGADYYLVEYTLKGELRTTTQYKTQYRITSGESCRVRAMSNSIDSYKASAWSETFSYRAKLANATFNRESDGLIYWNRVSYAGGYRYKIGGDGEVYTTEYASDRYVSLDLIPLGESLYVQAYAEGYDDSDWALIYRNAVALAVPSVTVSRGTASWDAIEHAEGYLYRINDGEQTFTAETSVSGLTVGDRITVCATSSQVGYESSAWSEERTCLPVMEAPTLSIDGSGVLTFTAVEGASYYVCEIDGTEHSVGSTYGGTIEYGSSVRVRAVHTDGEYEEHGEWSQTLVRVDHRTQLADPVVYYDPERGLVVETTDTNVGYYTYKFEGMEYLLNSVGAQYSENGMVLTQSFASNVVYVQACPIDDTLYKDSEWVRVEINFV